MKQKVYKGTPTLASRRLLFDDYILFYSFVLLFALGIGCYFIAPFTIPIIGLIGLSLLVLVGLLFCFKKGWTFPFVVSLLLLAGLLGFLDAQGQSLFKQQPLFNPKNHNSTRVTGTLQDLDFNGGKGRLMLCNIKDITPKTRCLRLSIRTWQQLHVGDTLTVDGRLFPLSPPLTPQLFNFKRWGYFTNIEATGYVRKLVKITPWREWSRNGIRQTLATHFYEDNPIDARALSIALLTGKRAYLSPRATQDMRHAGLAHMLAISGLHLGLICGLIFFTTQIIFGRILWLNNRFSIHKLAGMFTLIGSFIYLQLAGNTLPTLRAFGVVCLVIGGLLFYRKIHLMRLAFMVALLILIVSPYNLLSPSFQMSFSATLTLIAVYTRQKNDKNHQEKGFWQTFFYYLIGIIGASLIATLATAPFVLFHFGRLSVYGVLANLMAIPILTFWVLPLGFLSLISLPFNLAPFFLNMMDKGCALILKIANITSHLDGAVFQTLPPSWLVIWSLVISAFTFHFIKTRLRFISVIPLCFAIIIYANQKPYDILVSSSSHIAIKEHNTLYVLKKRGQKFLATQWGAQEGLSTIKSLDTFANKEGKCKASCFIWLHHYTVRIQNIPDPLCQPKADIVLAPNITKQQACQGKRLTVDKSFINQCGGLGLYLTKQGIKVDCVKAHQGHKPWNTL